MQWDNPLIYIVSGVATLSGIVYMARWIGRRESFEDAIGDDIREIRTEIKEILKKLDRD